NWVYWAPFWHPDGRHIVYTAADHSDPLRRPNYDLWWMAVPEGSPPAKPGATSDARHPKAVRLTFDAGADVLPVFSRDGRKLMWTATRNGTAQLFIAEFTAPKEE